MADKIKRIYLGDKMLPRIYRNGSVGSIYANEVDPRKIEGLVGWWDADDASTLTIEAGLVTQWNDKSSFNNNLPAVSGNEPNYEIDSYTERGAINWGNQQGNNKGFLLNPISSSISVKDIYVVCDWDAGVTSTEYAAIVVLKNRILGLSNTGTAFYNVGFNGQIFLNGTLRPYPLPDIQTQSVVRAIIAIDEIPSNIAVGKWGGFTGRGWPGKINEIILFDRELSEIEDSMIRNYLRTKWQIGFPPNYEDNDVNTYIEAVEAADGVSLEPEIRDAYNDFIVGCKSDGIWDSIKASCLLCGAKTLNGALVPLAGTAPTNNNFVTADYDRKTGLKGNGSNKSLNTNRPANADDQNYRHVSIWISEAATGSNDVYLGTVATNPTNIQRLSPTVTSFAVSGGTYRIRTTDVPGFVAAKRENANKIITWMSGSGQEEDSISGTSTSQNLYILDRSVGSLASDGRVAFYSIGEALDLEKLDNRVSRFMAENKFFLNTGLSGKDYDIDTLNYINAGYENGGSIG